MKKIRQFSSLLLIALTGCATRFQTGGTAASASAAPVHTPAPTLHMGGKTTIEVKRAMIRVYLAENWKLDREETNRLVFVKEVSDKTARLWYGWRPDNPVFVREQIDFVEENDAAIATPRQEIIATYGSVKMADPVKDYEMTAARFAKVEAAFKPTPENQIVGHLARDWFSQVDAR